MTLNDLEPQNRGFSVFLNLWLRRSFQEWIATKGIEMDQDNLRIGTAKAVAHLIIYELCSNYLLYSWHAAVMNAADTDDSKM